MSKGLGEPLFNTIKIVNSGSIRLWTETLGHAENDCIVLISGAGASAKFWSDDFCAMLVKAGFCIIRFDHRDQNMSDALDWDIKPYSVYDIATDVINIMNAYQITRAHVVGHSMGGTVAQLLAIHHPERLFSFTSMSVSTVGKLISPPKEVMDILMENKPTQQFQHDLQGFMRSWQVLNGTYTLAEDLAVAYTKDLYERTKHPVGVAWNHIRCQNKLGDISEGLKHNNVPALFIHGESDPLIPIEGGIETFNTTNNAKMVKIPGMGHMFFHHGLERIIANTITTHLSL